MLDDWKNVATLTRVALGGFVVREHLLDYTFAVDVGLELTRGKARRARYFRRYLDVNGNWLDVAGFADLRLTIEPRSANGVKAPTHSFAGLPSRMNRGGGQNGDST